MEDRKVLFKDIDRFITCSLCQGYFRFAHTIAECGHTFCKLCIFEQISREKGKVKQCPQCYETLEADLQTSVRKDTFKQSLADALHPEFAMEEHQMVKRVRELYPHIDLEVLLDEFNYDSIGARHNKRKKVKVNPSEQILPTVVTETLGFDFDIFIKKIYNEKDFNDMSVYLREKFPQLYYQQQQEEEMIAPTQQADTPKIIEKPKDHSDNTLTEEKKVPSKLSTSEDNNVNKTAQKPETNAKALATKNLSESAGSGAPSAQLLQDDEIMFNLWPKTDDDFKIVHLKNQLKLKNQENKKALLAHVKSFLGKRAENYIQKQVPQQPSLNPDNYILEIYEDDRVFTDDYITLESIKDEQLIEQGQKIFQLYYHYRKKI